MSQILEAIEKADAARKHGDKARLTQQEALSHVVHSTSVPSQKRLWLLASAAFIGLVVICFMFYRATFPVQAAHEVVRQADEVRTRQKQDDERLPAVVLSPTSTMVSVAEHEEKEKANVHLEEVKRPEPDTDAGVKRKLGSKSVVNTAAKEITKSSMSSTTEINSIDLPEVALVPKVAVDLPKPAPVRKKAVSRETVKKSPRSAQKTTASTASAGSSALTSKKVKTRTGSPFRINVLMFDEDASKRFVIVQGQRLNVGDSVPNTNYRISAIRRDGVIVEGEQGAMFVKAL